MRQTQIRCGMVVALLFASAASAQTWAIPQGEFQAFADLKWQPKCEQYWRGYLTDADNRRRATQEWLACVDRQSRNDLEAAASAIRQGRERAIQEKLREVRGY